MSRRVARDPYRDVDERAAAASREGRRDAARPIFIGCLDQRERGLVRARDLLRVERGGRRETSEARGQAIEAVAQRRQDLLISRCAPDP